METEIEQENKNLFNQTPKLNEALGNFQNEIGAIKKNSFNPFFKSKYADLSAIFDAIKKPMFKNGLSFTQVPIVRGELLILKTIIKHSSGEELIGYYPVLPVKKDPQQLGSAYTYAKRYSISSMLGIATDDEDDGNAGSQPKNKTDSKKSDKNDYKPNPDKLVSASQIKRLWAIMGSSKHEWNNAHVDGVIKLVYGCDSVKELNQVQYEWLTDKMVEMGAYDLSQRYMASQDKSKG